MDNIFQQYTVYRGPGFMAGFPRSEIHGAANSFPNFMLRQRRGMIRTSRTTREATRASAAKGKSREKHLQTHAGYGPQVGGSDVFFREAAETRTHQDPAWFAICSPFPSLLCRPQEPIFGENQDPLVVSCECCSARKPILGPPPPPAHSSNQTSPERLGAKKGSQLKKKPRKKDSATIGRFLPIECALSLSLCAPSAFFSPTNRMVLTVRSGPAIGPDKGSNGTEWRRGRTARTEQHPSSLKAAVIRAVLPSLECMLLNGVPRIG